MSGWVLLNGIMNEVQQERNMLEGQSEMKVTDEKIRESNGRENIEDETLESGMNVVPTGNNS